MSELDSLKKISSKLEDISKTPKKEIKKDTPLVLSKVGVDNIEIKNMIDSANADNYDALISLGIYYLTGTEVEQNYTLAKQIFEKCATKNIPHAFFGLGLIYQYGYNVDVDLTKSFECYEKGAELGSVDCIYRKGLYLLNGLGTNQDLKEAFNCFKKGASLNDANCLFALGNMYESGIGAQQNNKTALNYYHLASDLGHEDASCTLAVKHIEGKDVEKNIAKALELLEGPADNDDDDALYLLGTIYLSEDNVLNIDKAISYLKKASNLKNSSATYLLAHLYRDGFKHIEPNMLISRKYYKIAIEQGDINSKIEMTFFKRDNDGQWYFDYDAYSNDLQKYVDEIFAEDNENDEEEIETQSNASNEELNPPAKETTESEEATQETSYTPKNQYRNLYNAESISLDDIKVDPEFDELIKPTDINDKK